MPFLDRDDVKIHYETWASGSGAWITLLTGYARSVIDVRGMARSLAEGGYRVLALDNRGAGRGECAPVFTLDDMARDIATLWDSLSIGEGHLLGMGYGAAVVVRFAALSPSRVHSLVLVSPPVTAADLAPEIKGPSRNPRRLQAELCRYFSPGFLVREPLVVQGFMRQMAKVFQDPDTALGAKAQREAMADLDLRDDLPRVVCPTLVIRGELDALVPAAAAALLSSRLSRAELKTFPDTGHLVLVEKPAELYQSVREWLSRKMPHETDPVDPAC